MENNIIRGSDIKKYRKKHGLTQLSMAKKLGVTRETIVSYEKEDIIPSSKQYLIQKMISKDQMESENINHYVKNLTKNNEEIQINFIPFCDRDVTVGRFDLPESSEIPPSQMYYLPNFSDCTAIFPIYGDSMYPKFRPGEKVVVKEYPHFIDYIQYGEAYFVFTSNEERMIKIVRKASTSGFVKLVSINKEYDEFEIPLAIITKMFMVKGKISIEND